MNKRNSGGRKNVLHSPGWTDIFRKPQKPYMKCLLCSAQPSTLFLSSFSELRTLPFCEKNNKDTYMPINGR
jgi:hypothetical protein